MTSSPQLPSPKPNYRAALLSNTGGGSPGTPATGHSAKAAEGTSGAGAGRTTTSSPCPVSPAVSPPPVPRSYAAAVVLGKPRGGSPAVNSSEGEPATRRAAPPAFASPGTPRSAMRTPAPSAAGGGGTAGAGAGAGSPTSPSFPSPGTYARAHGDFRGGRPFTAPAGPDFSPGTLEKLPAAFSRSERSDQATQGLLGLLNTYPRSKELLDLLAPGCLAVGVVEEAGSLQNVYVSVSGNYRLRRDALDTFLKWASTQHRIIYTLLKRPNIKRVFDVKIEAARMYDKNVETGLLVSHADAMKSLSLDDKDLERFAALYPSVPHATPRKRFMCVHHACAEWAMFRFAEKQALESKRVSATVFGGQLYSDATEVRSDGYHEAFLDTKDGQKVSVWKRCRICACSERPHAAGVGRALALSVEEREKARKKASPYYSPSTRGRGRYTGGPVPMQEL